MGNLNWVKVGKKNIGKFTWRAKHVLLFPRT